MFKTSSISLSLLLGSISGSQIDRHHSHGQFSVGYNHEPFPFHSNHLHRAHSPRHTKKPQIKFQPMQIQKEPVSQFRQQTLKQYSLHGQLEMPTSNKIPEDMEPEAFAQHQAMESIKVLDLKKSQGKACQSNDWATVHWQTFIAETGEKVEDSKKFEKGHPKVIQLGSHESPLCWELSLSQMKEGENMKLYCPSQYGKGGQEFHGNFGRYADLGLVVPSNTDLIYQLQVLSCEDSLNKLNEKNYRAKNKAPLQQIEKTEEEGKTIIGSAPRLTFAQKHHNSLDDECEKEEKDLADQQDEADGISAKVAEKDLKHLKKAKKQLKKLEDEIKEGDDKMDKAKSKLKKKEESLEKDENKPADANKEINKEEKLTTKQIALDKEKKAVKKAEDLVHAADKIALEQKAEEKIAKKEKKEKENDAGKAAKKRKEKETKEEKEENDDNLDGSDSEDESDEQIKQKKKKHEIIKKAVDQVHKAQKKAELVKKPLSEQKKALDKPKQHKKHPKDIMKSFKCFYIEVTEPNHGHHYVLEVSTVDKYAPRNTGVYNVDLQIWNKEVKGKKDIKAQQWYYDYDKREIGSMLYPGKAMFAGFNGNVIIFNYKGIKNQKFYYHLKKKQWFNDHTHQEVQLKCEEIEAGDEAIAVRKDMVDHAHEQHWNIIPCDTEADAINKYHTENPEDEEEEVQLPFW